MTLLRQTGGGPATDQESGQPVCPYSHYELGFVWAIRFELVREAKQEGVNSRELLEWAIKPLNGVLRAHLERNPRNCLARMTESLKQRMAAIKCPTWGTVIGLPNSMAMEGLHWKTCTYCQKDSRIARSGLPHYKEFYLQYEPKN